MGSDITVFLEFFGLPGSGKSVISHLIAEQLREQGKAVLEPSYELDHICGEKKRKLVKFSKFVYFTLLHPTRCRRLVREILKDGYKGRDFLSQAVNIAYKICAYNESNVSYVIFDEGLIQSAISLGIYSAKTIEYICMFYGFLEVRNVIAFFLEVEPQIALKRLSMRDVHDSRVEKTSTIQQQMDLMNRYVEECHRLKEHMKGFEINTMERNNTEAACMVLKELERYRCQL